MAGGGPGLPRRQTTDVRSALSPRSDMQVSFPEPFSWFLWPDLNRRCTLSLNALFIIKPYSSTKCIMWSTMSWGLLALAQKLQGLKTISQGDNYMHNHGFTH